MRLPYHKYLRLLTSNFWPKILHIYKTHKSSKIISSLDLKMISILVSREKWYTLLVFFDCDLLNNMSPIAVYVNRLFYTSVLQKKKLNYIPMKRYIFLNMSIAKPFTDVKCLYPSYNKTNFSSHTHTNLLPLNPGFHDLTHVFLY